MDSSKIYILSIDQGTSGTALSIFDDNGNLVDSADITIKTSFPHSGWVEQDPYEILASIKKAFFQLVIKNGLQPGDILAMGMAHQGESLLLWDLETGEPVYNVIGWQDVRSTGYCQRMIENGLESYFHTRTGMQIGPEWPATKISWCLENVPKAAALYQSGRLAYSQIDAWLSQQITREKRFVTDHSMASRSGFYNIEKQNWDLELLELFQANRINLPEILDSNGFFGTVELEGGWNFPWLGNIIDQASSLLGQACTRPGDAKITYGTCASYWYNLGASIKLSNQMSTSVAWKIGSEITYAAVGETTTAGATIVWMEDKLLIPWKINELSQVAAHAKGQEDLVFVSALSGLGAPHWVPEARGTIYGITPGTGLQHFVRAGLESVAFGIYDLVLYAAENENLILAENIKVDGGMTKNEYLMQFQADIMGKAILVPENSEGTSTGAAYLAGLTSGFYDGFAVLENALGLEKIYYPKISTQERERKYNLWKNALAHTIAMYKR